MNNKYINYKKKSLSSIVPFTEKIMKKNWNIFDFRSDPESDPDPYSRKRIRGAGSACSSKCSGSETLEVRVMSLL